MTMIYGRKLPNGDEIKLYETSLGENDNVYEIWKTYAETRDVKLTNLWRNEKDEAVNTFFEIYKKENPNGFSQTEKLFKTK